jgi:alpha-N-acetylglucosaminidase
MAMTGVFSFNRWIWLLLSTLAVLIAATETPSTAGLTDLVQRRIPQHVDSFIFQINANNTEHSDVVSQTSRPLDEYTVSSTSGKILIEGNSLSALAAG